MGAGTNVPIHKPQSPEEQSFAATDDDGSGNAVELVIGAGRDDPSLTDGPVNRWKVRGPDDPNPGSIDANIVSGGVTLGPVRIWDGTDYVSVVNHALAGTLQDADGNPIGPDHPLAVALEGWPTFGQLPSVRAFQPEIASGSPESPYSIVGLPTTGRPSGDPTITQGMQVGNALVIDLPAIDGSVSRGQYRITEIALVHDGFLWPDVEVLGIGALITTGAPGLITLQPTSGMERLPSVKLGDQVSIDGGVSPTVVGYGTDLRTYYAVNVSNNGRSFSVTEYDPATYDWTSDTLHAPIVFTGTGPAENGVVYRPGGDLGRGPRVILVDPSYEGVGGAVPTFTDAMLHEELHHDGWRMDGYILGDHDDAKVFRMSAHCPESMIFNSAESTSVKLIVTAGSDLPSLPSVAAIGVSITFQRVS